MDKNDKELITMTPKELTRYGIIKESISGTINGTQAAKQLGLSIRQAKRIKARVKKHGAKGVIHAGRGKPGNRKTEKSLVKKIVTLIKSKYYDFGPTFAQEKLKEVHDMNIGVETLRQLMIAHNLWKPKPRRKTTSHRAWRPRKEYYGEMQQFDGSYDVWFGGEESCLLLSVDDANGKITHGKFDYNEGTLAVFGFWKEYFLKHGLPVSIYLDRFSTYKINHKNAVDNKELITQFQRATRQIGVKLITARSPEAKGRIERMFRTLQDRLIKEMRLAGVTDINKANLFLQKFIPKFNAKFSVLPQRKKDLHRVVGKKLKKTLTRVLSIQSERRVNNDYTIRFKNQYFQLEQEQPTTVYKKDMIIVEEHLNQDIKLNLKGKYLKYYVLPERPKKVTEINLPAISKKKQSQWKPPADHPWRNRGFSVNTKTLFNGTKRILETT